MTEKGPALIPSLITALGDEETQAQVWKMLCTLDFRSITLSIPHVDFKCIFKCAFFFSLLKKDYLVLTMADCPTCGYPTLVGHLNSQATSLIPPGSQKTTDYGLGRYIHWGFMLDK